MCGKRAKPEVRSEVLEARCEGWRAEGLLVLRKALLLAWPRL